MTDKEKRFCEEYIIDLNATQAAIRAGYSAKTAGNIGNENLNKPHLKSKIAELQGELSERTKIRAEDVIRELAKIGFSNIKNLFDEEGNLLNIKSIPFEITAAISEIAILNSNPKSKRKPQLKLKMYDKRAALVDLGKHFGIFKEDNDQTKTVINVVPDLSKLSLEDLENLKEMKEKLEG